MKINLNDVFLKSDLIEYVRAAGGKPQWHGSRWSSHCPLHGGDNKTAFSINASKRDGRLLWNCFSGDCGGGDAITFVQRWQGLSFREACEWILGERITDFEYLRQSAAERYEQAREDERKATERKLARLHELQTAERHLFYMQQRKTARWATDAWERAGLDEGIQDFFYLGASEDFSYWYDGVEHHTKTLTIPYFNEARELTYIQHRLENAVDGAGKYRPDKSGIELPYFLAVPEAGYDGGIVLVVEGAKKAMVAWTRANTSDFQAIGVPSLVKFPGLADSLRECGKRVIVIPDPRANERDRDARKPYDLAREIGAKVLRLPSKVDDFLLDTGLRGNGFMTLLKQARKI